MDLIFSKHLCAISFSLLSLLTSLLYIGGAHIFDVSLIVSLNWVVSFSTAYDNKIPKISFNFLQQTQIYLIRTTRKSNTINIWKFYIKKTNITSWNLSIICQNKSKRASCNQTWIASKVVDREPNGLSRAWTIALNKESALSSSNDALSCWMDIHHTPKLQTDYRKQHKM